MEKEDRVEVQITGNPKYECLLKIWDRYRKWLAPSLSPLMSFITQCSSGLDGARIFHIGQDMIWFIFTN